MIFKIIKNIKNLVGFKKKVTLEEALLSIKTEVQTSSEQVFEKVAEAEQNVIDTFEDVSLGIESIISDIDVLKVSRGDVLEKITSVIDEVTKSNDDLVSGFTIAKQATDDINIGLTKVSESINNILTETKEQSIAMTSLFDGIANIVSEFSKTENSIKESNTQLFEPKFKGLVDAQDKANVILLKDVRRAEVKMEDISSKLEDLIKAVNIIAKNQTEPTDLLSVEDVRRIVNENRTAFVEDSVGKMANIVNKKFETISNESNRNSNKLEAGINLIASTTVKTLEAVAEVRNTVEDIEEDVNQVQEIQQETADTINMEIRPFLKGKKLSI